MREKFRWSEIKNLDVGYRNRERTVDPAVVPSLEWRGKRKNGVMDLCWCMVTLEVP